MRDYLTPEQQACLNRLQCLHADDFKPPPEDLAISGSVDMTSLPSCMEYLRQSAVLSALILLADELMMAPAPAPGLVSYVSKAMPVL